MKKFSKAIAFKAITLPVLAALLATTINVPFASARGDSAMPKAGLNASAAPVTDVSAARKYRRAVPRHYVRRHGGNAAAAAMFGMVAGTIVNIAAAEARRDRARVAYYDNDGYYDDEAEAVYVPPRHYYPVPQPYVAPAVRYHHVAPQPHFAPRHHVAPQYVPQHRPHYRQGGHHVGSVVPQVAHPHHRRHWEGPGGR